MAIEKYALKAVLEFEDKLSPKLKKTITRLRDLEKRVQRLGRVFVRFAFLPHRIVGRAVMALTRRLGRLAGAVGNLILRVPVLGRALKSAGGLFAGLGRRVFGVMGRAFSGVVSGAWGMAKKFGGAVAQMVASASSAGQKILEKLKVPIMAVGAAITGFLYKGIDFAGSLEQVRIGLESVAGSAKEAEKELEMLKRFAIKTPFDFLQLARLYQPMRAAGFSAKESLWWLERMGDTLSALGRTDALPNMIQNLIQIRQAGKAAAIDIKQMALAGIPIRENLAKALGVSVKNLDEMISKGKVTADVVTKAFEIMAGEGTVFHKAMVKQSKTFKGVMDAFKESLQITASEIVMQTGLFDALKVAIAKMMDFVDAHKDDLVEFIKKATKEVEKFVEKLEPLGNFFKEHEDVVKTFVVTLSSLVGVILALGAVSKVVGLLAVAFNPLTVALLGVAAAVALLKRAWDTNFLGIRDIAMRFVGWLQKFAMPAIENVFESIKKGFGKLVGWFKKRADVFLAIWGVLWETFKLIAGTAWDWVSGAFKVFWEVLKGVLEVGFSVLAGRWEQAWESLKNSVKGVIDAIVGMFERMYNRLISWIDALGSKFRTLREKMTGGGFFGRLFGRRASGGLLGAGLYTVGEQGPEVIAKTSKGIEVLSATGSRSVAGGVVVNLNVNSELVTRELVRQVFLQDIVPVLRRLHWGTKLYKGIKQ